MINRLYPLLHIFLIIAAGLGTLWAWHAWKDVQNTTENKAVTSAVRTPETEKVRHGKGVLKPRRHLDFPGKDVLWKKFLFAPQRHESVEDTKTPPDHNRQSRTDMELIGIGALGSNAAAVIRINAYAGSDRKERYVYAIGEHVGTTGYKVHKITINEATLSKNNGEERRVLRIHRQDAASRERSKQALQHAAKVRKQTKMDLQQQMTQTKETEESTKSTTLSKKTQGRSGVEKKEPPAAPPKMAEQLREKGIKSVPKEKLEKLRKALTEKRKEIIENGPPEGEIPQPPKLNPEKMPQHNDGDKKETPLFDQ